MNRITLCGSSKNHTYISNLAKCLENKGFCVFVFQAVDNLFSRETNEDTRKLVMTGLTLRHFEKIKKSDIVLFANLNGYTGCGATLELGFAVANSKIIVALNHDAELARECLFDLILDTEDGETIAQTLAEKFL